MAVDFDAGKFEELVLEGKSDRAIEKEMGVGRMTVKNQFLTFVY